MNTRPCPRPDAETPREHTTFFSRANTASAVPQPRDAANNPLPEAAPVYDKGFGCVQYNIDITLNHPFNYNGKTITFNDFTASESPYYHPAFC